jgi:hypothetical protein
VKEKLILSPQFIRVLQCSNQSHVDICQSGSASYSLVACPIFAAGLVGFNSIVADHIGCWGGDSDNGEDIYQASVGSGWAITGVIYNPGSATLSPGVWLSAGDNSTMDYTINPPALPASLLNINVNWHIGASGGYVAYNFQVEIEGPVGVPFQ